MRFQRITQWVGIATFVAAGGCNDLNVDNPDLGLLLSHQLDNTGVVVIKGNPQDGWTLVSCVVVPGFEFAGFELAPPGWQPGR